MNIARSLSEALARKAIALFAHLVTAARADWEGVEPVPEQRIYFANHTSHGDFLLIWSVLPPALRAKTRAVAAADYWLASPLRTFIGRDVFKAVLIDRRPEARSTDPVTQMAEALDEGASLILFPEGTRNTTTDPLMSFKSGLYHISVARPDVSLVPVWIGNLNHVMPKGEFVPIPLICTVKFGAPLRQEGQESKDTFLRRAETALRTLSPAGVAGR